MAATGAVGVRIRVPAAQDHLSKRGLHRDAPEPGGGVSLLGTAPLLDLGPTAVLFPTAVLLLGPVHLVRRDLESRLDGGVRVRDAHRHPFLLLPAHRTPPSPTRFRICLTWWRAWAPLNPPPPPSVRAPSPRC